MKKEGTNRNDTVKWMHLTQNLLKPQASEIAAEDISNLIQQLSDVLQFHEWRYYVLNDPIISDAEYDRLFHRLLALEEENPHLAVAGSPTGRVASDLTEDFPSVRHWSPMLSLSNSFNADDLRAFDKRVKNLCGLPETEEIIYHVEPKFDGGSLVLQYEQDILTSAATRGNGEFGELITTNARAMRSVPLKAGFSKHGITKVELRGEVVIRKDVFEQVNETRIANNESILANARNAATGAMRVKDSGEVVRRGLETFVYQIAVAYNESGDEITEQTERHSKAIDLLDKLGFKVPTGLDVSKTLTGIDAVIAFCSTLESRRDGVPYEIDGMVIKVDRIALQKLCGATSHHPRWATALKFKARQASSKLLNVEFQVGKVGAVTPVAKIQPVQLAGVTVSSISLHNEEFIQSRDIRLNDTVLVERAGDVIPYIVKSFPELRDGSEQVIKFPEQCPSCGATLQKIKDEAAWRCVNPDCEAQLLQKIIHFVSKDAMDIDGLGKQLIERFYNLGYIRSFVDIFRLDYAKIQQLDGFGEKSAINLKASVEKAKGRPIHRLLYGLGIHHVGKRASKLLTSDIGHLVELADKSEEELVAIKDIGPVVAANVIAFFGLEKNKALIETLETLGVNLSNEAAKQTDDITEGAKNAIPKEEQPLFDKTILFTGSLQQMNRREAAEMAEQAGARVISAVSGNLDILVVGENAGSKLKKAQALGSVQILSEEEFLKMIAKE